MKVLRLAGLGVLGTAIWGLSLVWPEVNLMLTPSVMMGLVLGLAALAAIYILSQHRAPEDNNIGRNNHPSRPIPVVQMR